MQMELFHCSLTGDFLRRGAQNAEIIVDIVPSIFYRLSVDSEFTWRSLPLSPGDFLFVTELVHLLEALNEKHLVFDIKKEKSVREKSGHSYFIPSDVNHANEFENGDHIMKVKLVISELIQFKLIESSDKLSVMKSELFSCQAFQMYILCIICYLLKSFPQHFELCDVIMSILYLDDMESEAANSYEFGGARGEKKSAAPASFLSFKHGLDYIRLLVCNFPHEWDAVCQSTLRHLIHLQQHNQHPTHHRPHSSQQQELRNLIFERHREVLRLLLRLQPSRRLQLLDSCIEQTVLPDMVLELAIEMDGDREVSLISILKRILFTSPAETRIWFCKFLQKNCSTTLMGRLDKQLFSILTSLTNFANAHSPELPPSSLMLAQQFVQVFAALLVHARRSFPPMFLKNLLVLMTASVPISQEGNTFIVTALAFLVAFYSLFMRVGGGMEQIELEGDVVRWLKSLLNCQAEFQEFLLRQQQRSCSSNSAAPTGSSSLEHANKSSTSISGSSGSSCSHVELLLLIAIFCQSEPHHGVNTSHTISGAATVQPPSTATGAAGLAGVVSQLLEVPIHASSISLNSLQKIFLREVYREKVITAQLASMPVTKDLSALSIGYFPIHCVISLLRNRAFVKNKIDIKEWIFAQMCACRRPSHPHLPELLDCFVNSLFAAMLSNASGGGMEQHSTWLGMEVSSVSQQQQHHMALVNRPIPEEVLSRLFTADICGTLAAECALAEVKRREADSTSNHVYSDQVKSTRQVRRDYTPQILAMYYLLKYHETMECRALEFNAKRKPILFYSRKIWNEIPFGFLLHYMSSRGSDYSGGNLHSLLLKMVIELFPELQLSQYRLKDELMLKQDSLQNNATEEQNANQHDCPTPATLDAAFTSVATRNGTVGSWIESQGRSQAHLLHKLRTLLATSQQDPLCLVPFCHTLVEHLDLLLMSSTIVSGSGTAVLDMPVGRQVAETYFQLWCRLRILMPRRLHLLTLHAFRRRYVVDERDRFLRGTRPPTLEEYEVYQDPIENLLMYVDDSVFRSPHALSMVLRILDFALTCNAKSRFPLMHSPHASPPVPPNVAATGGGTEDATPASPMQTGAGLGFAAGSGGATPGKNFNPPGVASNTPTMGGGPPSSVNANTNAANAASFGVFHPGSAEHAQRMRQNYQLLLESTAVQVMLERCLPLPWEKADPSDGLSVRRECSLLVCEYLHMLFIRDENGLLCQLVHRQTYPASLLPLTVRSIPSLHVVLSSVQTNFQHSGKMDVMLFSLDLISQLAEMYNIQKALQPCRVILEMVLAFSANALLASIRPAFFLSCVEPAVRISRAFPCLQATASKLLTMATHQSRSELARLGVPVPEELKVTDVPIRELLSQCKTMSLREQYEHCYWKCRNALAEISHRAHIQHLCYSSCE